ncbi:MAG: protein kinase domain-containing protein [Thermoanaerobaculia bacterium]
MELEPGTRLGSYEIRNLLGAGGMGEVYRAIDTKLGREVAIKVLPESSGRDASRISRFEREARLLASVNHPGIAAIYGAEEAGDQRYLILELVEGKTLSDHLRGPLSMRETLRIARQIAEALEAAHERGIVHRDLKPANVMVTPDGRAKILDLGLAKIAGGLRSEVVGGLSRETTAALDETRPGVILGTIEFMSPEQARGKAIDKRTDIWAFGCIVFECLSGRRAFTGDSVPDAFAAILRSEPEWDLLPPETPPALREMLARCLQKDPAQRLRDIGDARLAIEELLLEIDPRRPTSRSVIPLPAPRRLSKSAKIAAGAAAALVAGAALVITLRPRRKAEPPASSPAPPTASAIPPARLLAILPFRDLSSAPDGKLLGEGLVETVSSAIGGSTGLQVVSPAAVIAASAKEPDPLNAARDLGASQLLQGAVQRSRDRVRITYSLWDVRKRAELSGGTLDGSASDLFELQDRLVAKVSEAESIPAVRRVSAASGLPSGTDQERYLKAVGLLQHYNTRESVENATAILETLSQEAPRSPYVFASLARAYLEHFDLTHDSGDTSKAETAARRARELGPSLIEVDITLGELRLHSGGAAGAVEAFQQALAASPTSFEARLGLARALGAAGRDADAEKAFREALNLQPTYWGGYSKLAGFYYARGRYEEAAAAFRRVTELTPDNAMALSNLGGAYFLANDLEKALAAFRRSLALQPTGFAQSNIGTVEFFLGNYAQSAAAFEEATKLTPDLYRVWSNLGDALRWTPGRQEGSRRAYSRALELCRKELERNPGDGLVRSILASSLAKTGKPTEALAEIRRASQAGRGDPDVDYQASVVYVIAHDLPAAFDELGKAVQSGYPPALVEKDPEFAGLRADKRFAIALTRGKEEPH